MEYDPWEQLTDEGEPHRWYHRFVLFRNMGPNRTLLGAVNAEKDEKRLKKINYLSESWVNASKQWNWKARAQAWDAHLQAEQDARQALLREVEQQEIERIMTTGYAAVHNRVATLDRWAREVEASMINPETGKVNPKWVSADKLREWRGMLEDIASETGGRIKTTKQEVSATFDFTGAKDSLFHKIASFKKSGPDDHPQSE